MSVIRSSRFIVKDPSWLSRATNWQASQPPVPVAFSKYLPAKTQVACVQTPDLNPFRTGRADNSLRIALPIITWLWTNSPSCASLPGRQFLGERIQMACCQCREAEYALKRRHSNAAPEVSDILTQLANQEATRRPRLGPS